MERIDRIVNNKLFLDHLEQNRAAEVQRRFCRHGMEHFLDVARIGRLINDEEGLGLSCELIYAAALLHDIGKHLQYAQGIPHEQASARIAPEILEECGFHEQETEEITAAILSHRNEAVASERSLRGVLYRADKASRACFCCGVREECSWREGRKNLQVLY